MGINVENLELEINDDYKNNEENTKIIETDINKLELDNSKEEVHCTIKNKSYNLLERQLMQEEKNTPICIGDDMQFGIDKLNIDEMQAIGIANKNSNLDID